MPTGPPTETPPLLSFELLPFVVVPVWVVLLPVEIVSSARNETETVGCFYVVTATGKKDLSIFQCR